MRPSLLLVAFFTSVAVYAQNSLRHSLVRILPESHLEITGTTNINTFKCAFDVSLIQGAKRVSFSQNKQGIDFKDTSLILQNKGFDCGHKAIDRDFHKLMQTEQFPVIELKLKKIRYRADAAVIATVDIKMVGKTNSYEFPVVIENGNILNLSGSLSLDIDDYGLEPPKKVLGLIKVKDEISISFGLLIDLRQS